MVIFGRGSPSRITFGSTTSSSIAAKADMVLEMVMSVLCAQNWRDEEVESRVIAAPPSAVETGPKIFGYEC